MTKRRLKLQALAALATVLCFPVAAHGSPYWGVDANGMLEQSPDVETSQLITTYDLGIRLGRFAVGANRTAADNQIAALVGHGIEPYPILSGGYGAFAKRYGVGGTFWTTAALPVHIYEIGNEPNIDTPPAQYAATYREARSQILARDPNADVVAGGVAAIFYADSFDVYDWTQKMITALGFCPGAIGYHAYPQSLEQLQAGLVDFRYVLDGLGCKSTAIELNEFYMLGGNPATLSNALTWITGAKLGISRVVLSIWCSAGDPSRGLFPAVWAGSPTPLGMAFISAVDGSPSPSPVLVPPTSPLPPGYAGSAGLPSDGTGPSSPAPGGSPGKAGSGRPHTKAKRRHKRRKPRVRRCSSTKGRKSRCGKEHQRLRKPTFDGGVPEVQSRAAKA